MNDAVNRMSSPDLPATITEAEAALELHQERKAEIDGRQDTFKVEILDFFTIYKITQCS